jgi:hypothetical protein
MRRVWFLAFTPWLFLNGAAADSTPQPPPGSVLLMRAHAVGYQIYGCEPNGEWSKAEPVAALVTEKGAAIRHYRAITPAAPTWEASDGSKAHATLENGKPDQSIDSQTPDSIPQLGLKIAASGEKGMLGSVTYVVRAATKSGTHPAGPCKLASGTRVPRHYEADYLFYSSR